MNELDSILVHAAGKGNTAKVKLLLPLGADPKANNSWALNEAAYYGRTDCVELLIPVSDPKANNSSALLWAACNGHTDCVKLLIPVSDPKDYDRTLARATYYGSTDCAKLIQETIDERAR